MNWLPTFTLKLALQVGAALAVVGAVLWFIVIGPTLTDRANLRATKTVTTTTAAVPKKVEAATTKAQEKTNERVVIIERRSAARAGAVGVAGDDREFWAGLCESRLYSDDPRCRSAGVESGSDRSTKRGR